MRHHLTLAAVAAAALLAPATALAQNPDAIRLDPNTAGKASHLLVDLRTADDPQADNRTPISAVLAVQDGFKFDNRARAARCSGEQARNYSCPSASRIGSGNLYATVDPPFGAPQQITGDVEFFLAPPQQSGDVAGIVIQFRENTYNQRGTTTARVARTGGAYPLEVRMDNLGGATPPPPGWEIRLDRFTADIGAARTEKIKKYRYVRRSGKKKRVRYYKKVRRDLIRNPRTCDGAWEYQVRARYSQSEPESTRDGSVACASARR